MVGSCYSQEATLTAGGEASGSGGTVSYSIGQTIIESASGNNGMLSSGVQQAIEVMIETGFEDVAGIDLTVFPNPTTDDVVLAVENSESLSYQLFNLKGELLKESDLVGGQTNISLSETPAGAYLLKVINNDQEVKVFKIIKH